jgi:acyl-CoA synthetase (AMP-forming)/AMP-acid ligase II
MNLIDFFDRGALHHPDRDCFVAGERRYRYRQIRALTLRLANGLRGLGFGEGKKGAVLSLNDPISFSCALAILRTGGAWVPLNPKSAVDEHALVLSQFDCDIVFYQQQLAPVVDALKLRVPTVRHWRCIDAAVGAEPAVVEWAGQLSEDEVDLIPDPDRLAMLVGTGGTTGRPKGVMLSNRSVETFSATTLAVMPHEAPPVYLAAAPLTHAAGILCFPFFAEGATIVVHAKVDPQAILVSIARDRVTTLFLPPTAIYMLLAQPNVRDFDYSSLRYFIYGAAPMSTDKLKEALLVFGPVMAQLYGQSESPMLVTFLTPREHFVRGAVASDERLRSCGRATPFTRASIMADDGRHLPAGEVGEIVVRGDLVMSGYYQDPAETAASQAHGWHHTGDLGYRDADGYYTIVDRKKDLIISGGFNIYPGEIEQVLWSHPAVQDCAVIGVPDDKWGEAVKALVELKPGQAVTPAALIEFCKMRLSSVKAPKTVEILDSLPRSAVGKVLKKELRARYWEGRARKI